MYIDYLIGLKIEGTVGYSSHTPFVYKIKEFVRYIA